MRTFIGIMSFVWIAIAILGLLSDSDTVFIVGLVNSVVNSVAGTIIDTINKKEKE